MRRRFSWIAAAAALGVGLCSARASAALLPDRLMPAAPFPLVLGQSLEREFVAPGVERATYRLQTSAGPLVVSLVHVDPRQSGVRFGTVLARDRIVSNAETVSSMAARTGAVAGINADYFDIGNTNAPLGIFTQNGALIRTPSSRTALTVGRDGSIRFGTYGFHGTASVNGSTSFPVTSVNEWPPHGGAAFLTPAYGGLTSAAAQTTMVAELTPVDNVGAASAAPAPAGRYRVTQIDTGTLPAQAGFALGLGRAVQDTLAALPDVGDLIDIAVDTDPPLAGVQTAVGGGPALLAGGTAVDDPLSPGYAERARRIPAAVAARLPDGDIALVVIDGRHPAISIGVNRAELIALLSALGATNAMQFDSGGSATLVARVLGESGTTLLNEPSDGVERPVADGLFVYSDAPIGPPARLVVRPSTIVALPDTAIALRAAIVDAAGHALGPARGSWTIDGNAARIDDADELQTGSAPTTTTLHVERDGVRADLPLDIVANVTTLAIAPERPDPDAGASIALRALAFDSLGRPVAVGGHVTWSALRGAISTDGTFTAGDVDGFVTATVGGVKSSETIHVGRHQEPLPGFDAPNQGSWHFSSIPVGGPGALAFGAAGTLQISYDFRATERAAYAGTGVNLGEPLAVSCAIDGDGGGAGVRIALLDRYGERSTLTLAKTVDWTGAQRREARVPAALAPPIALQSIYVIGSLGPTPVKTAGTIGIRGCTITLPGSAVAPRAAPSAGASTGTPLHAP